MEDEKALGQYTKIVVETDEKNPVTIAVIQSNFVDTTEGYRVRLTPKYDWCSVSFGGQGSLP